MAVKVPQRVTHSAPVVNGPGQLRRRPTRLAYLKFDPSTLLPVALQALTAAPARLTWGVHAQGSTLG